MISPHFGLNAPVPNVPPAPTASVEPSVAVSVSVFDAVSALPSATVSVALVAGAVIATLLMLVAVATPRTGVVSVGLVARTGAPEPCAAVHTGNADAPPPTRISVVAPAASV